MQQAETLIDEFRFDAQLDLAVSFVPLKPGPKCLLHYLAGTYNKNISNNIWPGNEGMAKVFGVSIKTIKNWKQELVDGGWIHIVECVQRAKYGKLAQQSNYHYLSESIMINYRLRRKELKFLSEPSDSLAQEIQELKELLTKAQKETRNKNRRPAQVASLVRAGIVDASQANLKKPIILKYKQKRSSNVKCTGGGDSHIPLTTNTNNAPSMDEHQNDTTSLDTRGQGSTYEKELKEIGALFSEGTGLSCSDKKLREMDKIRQENGLSLKTVEQNVRTIIESPVLCVTTNSIVRAGHLPSLLAFGVRRDQVKLERAAQAGELNKELGNRFRSEFEAVKTVLPDMLKERAQKLDSGHKDPIEWGYQYLSSLSDQEFITRSYSYEGGQYRTWKQAQGFSSPPEAQTFDQFEAQSEAQTSDDPKAQPEIDFSGLPDIPF